MQTILAQMKAGQDEQPGKIPVDQPIASTTNVSWSDPQIHLQMASTSGKGQTINCHYDVVDYIAQTGAAVHEEIVTTATNGSQLIWRAGDKKPQLTSLTIPQWPILQL